VGHPRLALLACALALGACSSAPVPFADAGLSSTPTAPASALEGAPALLRYGLDERLNGLIDLSPLEGRGLVEWLPTGASVAGYDVVLALAEGADWQPMPQRLSLSLAYDARVAPLDQPDVLDTVRRAWSPEADVLQVRAAWAALGRLDGPRLTLRHPAHPLAQTRLSAPTLDIVAQPSADVLADWQAQRGHLYLLLWTADAARSTWEAQVGAENLQELTSWPLGYRLADGLRLESVRPDGLPLAQRSSP